MSKMIEIYCTVPHNQATSSAVAAVVRQHHGEITFFEEDARVCLTAEFYELDDAESAADAVRTLGLHVEGPGDY